MQARDEHIGKMEKQLQEWGAKLDMMSANAKAAGANAKADERNHPSGPPPGDAWEAKRRRYHRRRRATRRLRIV